MTVRLNNASFGYFGLFLSRAMYKLGQLGTLYTNLPWTRLRDLPHSHWRSQPLLLAPAGFARLGLPKWGERVEPLTVRLFSRWVAATLTECDIFHCFSGFGLEAFRAARKRWDAMTIVERGSSHIRFQNDVLVEEYARWGLRFPGIRRERIDREEAEYDLCDRITVQSTFAERTFLERGIPQDKIIKLPLGVDLTMFRPVPKKDSMFRVLYAGHCSIRKGIPYLLEAISKLNLPRFEFVINGTINADMTEVMRRYPANYRFLGHQPLERLHEVYSQASVLVLPTIEDGFAKVITEAMACGVPVIATGNCGAPDVIDDGVDGFVVPIRNAAAIQEKIQFLYEFPEIRDAMGRAALDKARSLVDWDSYGGRAAAMYQRALDQRRGRNVA